VSQPAGERDGVLVPLEPPPDLPGRKDALRNSPGRKDALRPRTQWTFEHAGRVYAVFDIGGELLVTDNACPHNGGPLADGLVRDGVVTCPWHWYSYELATGRCRTAAGYELRRYPVVQRDGRPYAVLPAAAPARSWSDILRQHARGGCPPASGLRPR
jgi:nitrite reductase/ring-hydroxylating ferredoxin subunit